MENRISKRDYVATEINQTRKRLASSLKAFLNGSSVGKEHLYTGGKKCDESNWKKNHSVLRASPNSVNKTVYKCSLKLGV